MAFFVRNGGDDGALARGEKRAVHDADGAQLACEHWRDQDGLKESKKEASGAAQTRHVGLLGVGAATEHAEDRLGAGHNQRQHDDGSFPRVERLVHDLVIPPGDDSEQRHGEQHLARKAERAE